MPRDAGGTYTLPGGNPVVSGTVIETSWANPTMADLANGLTDSLSRTGNGGMLVPFRVPNGAVGSPSLSFLNNILSGLYLFDTGDVRMTINGADLTRFSGGKTQEWSGSEWLNLYQTAALVPYDPSGSQLTGTNVQAALDEAAPVVSPAFTGTPTAPTPTLGDDSTKLATTAFVELAIDAVNPHRLFLGNTTNPLVDLKLQNQIDFTGSGAVTSTRASTATYIDRYGVVQNAAVDEPRFEAEGLLMEGASTNLLLRSEEFNALPWGAVASSVAPDNASAPDGTMTADTLTADGISSTSRLNHSIATSGDITFSCFVKDVNSGEVSFRVVGTGVGGGGDTASVYTFTFSTKSWVQAAGGPAIAVAFKEIDNGWFRLILSVSTVTVTQCNIYTTYNQAAAVSIILWGAQLEKLPFASSYIKTTSATVARAEDINYFPQLNNLCNTPFSIMTRFSFLGLIPNVANQRVFRATPAIGNALLSTVGNVSLRARIGGTDLVVVSPLFTDTAYQTVMTYDGDTMQAYQDGVFIGSLSGQAFTPDKGDLMGVGNQSIGNEPMWGHISRFEIFDRVLTDYEAGIV